MGYRLVQLDIADLPERLSLSESEGGLGLVFRDRGRVVGFHLVDGEQMGPERSCVPAALVGGETRIALEAERLRDDTTDGVVFRQLQCPGCGSTDVPISNTRAPIRYHVCRGCGKHFKSIWETS